MLAIVLLLTPKPSALRRMKYTVKFESVSDYSEIQ
jgi:hypothetical protein